MSVAASGILSTPIDNAANLLAASTNFQTLVGAADAAAAKLKIHQHVVSSGWSRPMALITHDEFTWNGQGSRFVYNQRLPIRICIEANVTTGTGVSEQDQVMTFTNSIGAIIQDMASDSGLNGALVVHSFRTENLILETEAERTGNADENYFSIDIVLDAGN